MFEIFHLLFSGRLSVMLAGSAYLGPDTVMPLASALAAVIGFILIFWRWILQNIKKAISTLRARSNGQPAVEPYVEPEDEQDSRPVV